MDPKEELEVHRAKINEIDKKILQLISKRFEAAERIGQIKLENGLPIKVFGVEKRVIEKNLKVGKQLGLYDELVEKATRLLIQYSVISQDEYHTRHLKQNIEYRKKILIIGGRGRMGKWLEGFFGSFSHQVYVFDKEDFENLLSPFENREFKACLERSDFVVLATPMSVTSSWIDALVTQKVKAIVFDICSLKSPIRISQKNAIDAGLQLCSVHPMFGPSVETLSGRNIVFSDCGNRIALEETVALFAESTATKLFLDCEEHDRHVSFVLGFSHYLNLIFAHTLEQSGIGIQALQSISSTTFANQLRVAKDVISENAALYYEIQKANAYSKELFQLFENEMNKLYKMIRDGDEGAFVAAMQNSKEYLFETSN